MLDLRWTSCPQQSQQFADFKRVWLFDIHNPIIRSALIRRCIGCKYRYENDQGLAFSEQLVGFSPSHIRQRITREITAVKEPVEGDTAS
jgi:hypothetical protein